MDSPKTSNSYNNERKIKTEESDSDNYLSPIKHKIYLSPESNSNERKRPKISSFKKVKENSQNKNKENKKINFENVIENNSKKEKDEKENEINCTKRHERNISSKSITKKPIRHVNFNKKCVTVIDVESYKKYNYLNTNRENLQKKSVSCKCKIF